MILLPSYITTLSNEKSHVNTFELNDYCALDLWEELSYVVQGLLDIT